MKKVAKVLHMSNGELDKVVFISVSMKWQ
jgi:hypothetical protein